MLPYGCSIHKSQGSEFPAVVVPLATQHYPMLEHNILYNAVTRGKRLAVVIGQPQAFAIAVNYRQGGPAAHPSRATVCLLEALTSTSMKRLLAILAYTLLPLSYAAGGSFDHSHRAWTELLRQHVVLI
ncbi:MAG: ATP-binding domain-containing protein, partial [Gammaproteobacteria bacterium]